MTHPPSSWRVIIPLGLAVCLSLFGDLTLYAVLVTQTDSVGLNLAAVGVMLGVNRLVRVPGNLIVGPLLDRWGRRPLFLLGLVLGACATASYGLVRGFWPFLLGRIGWGLAWTLINVGGRTIALDISNSANRGRVTGFYQAWMWAGFALGPLLGGYLTDRIGFRPTMLIFAMLTGVGLLVALLALPETLSRSPGEQVVAHRRTDDVQPSVFDILRSIPGFLPVAGLFLITQFAGEGVATSTLTLWLQGHFGQMVRLDGIVVGIATAGGVVAAVFSILAGVAGPAGGHLSDRIGRPAVVTGSLVLAIIGFIRLMSGGSAGAFAVGVALLAISSGVALAALTAQAGDLTPPGRQGSAMGVLATVSDVGLLLGPIAAFALLPMVGLPAVYGVCIIACALGLILVWWKRLRRTTHP